MEIDKVFDNASVDGVADNLFSAVRNSVSEIKAMQQRKAAENVQLVIQALKKIESDLQDKYDGVTTVIEKRVSTIKDGRDGINGRDGRDGKDGRPGKDGMPGPRGRDGAPGKDGVDGMDGVSVTDARIDFDGSLIIGLSSGREINVGEVVAPDLAERIKVITNGGGTSQSVLDTLASLQSQINALDGFLDYKGTWNASTNTPTLVSSTGTKGDYYVVSVAGSTNLNGETTWGVGDWVVFNNSVWQKVDGGSTGNFTTAAIATSLNLAYGTVSTALALDASKNVVSVTNTGTGDNVLAGSPTLTGTVNAAAVTMSSNLTLSGGTANGVAYLNGSKVLTTGSALTFDGSQLGVGVASPVAPIDIQSNSGGTGLRMRGRASGNTSAIRFFSNDSATQQARLESSDSYFEINSVSNLPMIFSVNNAEQMRLTSTGLGIGTSSPAAKLDVKKTSNDTISRTNAVGGFGDWDSLGAGLLMQQTLSSPYGFALQAANAANSVQFPLLLNPSGGNVGIGTSSPGAKLEVNGAVVPLRLDSITALPSNQASCYVGPISDTAGGGINGDLALIPRTSAGGSIVFATGSTTPSIRMRLDSSGNLGLGVTPSAWSSSVATQVGYGAALSSRAAGNTASDVTHGAYWNGTNWLYQYSSVGASRYQMTGANAGSTHAWFVSAGGTAGNAITFTQAMTLGANGNLAVGDTSTGNARLFSYISDASLAAINARQDGAGPIQVWNSGGSERARITSGGDLLVGTTSTAFTGRVVALQATSASDVFTAWNSATTGDNSLIGFFTDGGAGRGSITYNRAGGLVAYNTTSDYRAKDILGPVVNSGAAIDALKVYEGKMKGATQPRPMLVAHEAQAVAPYSVTGEKDAVNESGDPIFQQMDVSSLVPLLIAEIQSLRQRVAQLEGA